MARKRNKQSKRLAAEAANANANAEGTPTPTTTTTPAATTPEPTPTTPTPTLAEKDVSEDATDAQVADAAELPDVAAPTTPLTEEEKITLSVAIFRERLLRKAYRPSVRDSLNKRVQSSDNLEDADVQSMASSVPAVSKEVQACEEDFISIVKETLAVSHVDRLEWSNTCAVFSDRWPHISHWLHPGRLGFFFTTTLNVKFTGRLNVSLSRERLTMRAKKYKCVECDVVCNSLGQFCVHEKGRKHNDNLRTVQQAAIRIGGVYTSLSPLPLDGSHEADAYYAPLNAEVSEPKTGSVTGDRMSVAQKARLEALAEESIMIETASTFCTAEMTDASPTNFDDLTATVPEGSVTVPEESADVSCAASHYSTASTAFLSRKSEHELLHPLETLLHEQTRGKRESSIPREFNTADARTAAMAWMGANIAPSLGEDALRRGAELACSEQLPQGMQVELGKMLVDKLNTGPSLVREWVESQDTTLIDEAEAYAEEQNTRAWVRYAQTFAMSVHLAVQSAMPKETLASAAENFFTHATSASSQLPQAAQNHVLAALNALRPEEGKEEEKEKFDNVGETLSYFSKIPSGLHRSVCG